MLKHVMIDKQNNWAVGRNDIVFLWEPHKCDKLYHLAVLFDSIPDEGGLYKGVKAIFLESGKIYDVSEIDKECAFYNRRDVHGEPLQNSFEAFSIYLDKAVATKNNQPWEYHKFIKDYLTKIGKEDLFCYFFGDRRFDYTIPMRKVLDLAQEIVPMQEEIFGKQNPSKVSLTEKLKKQYLEPEQGR